MRLISRQCYNLLAFACAVKESENRGQLPSGHPYLLASLPHDNSKYILLYRPKIEEPNVPAPVIGIDLNTAEIPRG